MLVDSKILHADNVYRPICDLSAGDLVMNMHGQPVLVTSATKVLGNELMEIQHQNWHSALICNGDTKVLSSEQNWIPARNLEAGTALASYCPCTPTRFEYTINGPNKQICLEPCYTLGQIFGLYCGYGSIKDGTVEFKFGINKELADILNELLTKDFDAALHIKHDDWCIRVQTDSKHMVELFEDFGPKIGRTLPEKYWAYDEEYLQGIFDGLIEYDPAKNLSRYIAVSADMAQLFSRICSARRMNFINEFPHIKGTSLMVYPLVVDHEHDGENPIVLNVDQLQCTEETWLVTVECETNSYVVNGLIVKN